MFRLQTGDARATARLVAFATTTVVALAPLAAFADYDSVGKPFPLWVFLIPGAGIIALAAALVAKGAVERGR